MSRPILLFACHPLTGHVTPVLRIAAGLHKRGWQVAFLSSAFFRARIEAADLEFLPLLGAADLDDAKLFDRQTAALPAPLDDLDAATAARLPQSITDLRHQTLAALPDEWCSIQSALATLAAQNPGRRLMLVSEAFFYGSVPFKFGAAPLPPTNAVEASVVVPRTVCLSITAPAIRSVDLPPFGLLDPFDTTAAGRQKHAQTWDQWLDRVAPLTSLLRQGMVAAGAVDDEARIRPRIRPRIQDMVFLGGTNYTCHDAIAQVGVPEFEFPRSDFPPGFRIVGIVPPAPPAAAAAAIPFPWWPEITANARRKKVVVVAQGTVETEPTELILPTLRLLGRRADVITVAILGVRGARLSAGAGAPLPANARVADYLSYDAVLPYADLWVHNGGYGATMHGIAHGVPMVVAGDGQDKPENGKRVQYSGLGIDLETAHPDVDKLDAAIQTVLSDARYAAVAKSMQQTCQKMDCFGNVEAMILEEAGQ